MKSITTLLIVLLSTIAFAKEVKKESSRDLVVHCKASMQENGEKPEVHNFKFECDNYGEDATFTSKGGRYTVAGFSEESCTPQLIVHDSKTNTFTSAFASSERGSGFDVFKNKVVSAVSAEATLDQAFGNPDNIKNKAWVACSTNPTLLEEL